MGAVDHGLLMGVKGPALPGKPVVERRGQGGHVGSVAEFLPASRRVLREGFCVFGKEKNEGPSARNGEVGAGGGLRIFWKKD